MLDQNDGGAANRSTYQPFMTEAFARRDSGENCCLAEGEAAGVLPSGRFANPDMNGDGRFTQNELVVHVMADFGRADQDGTGRLE